MERFELPIPEKGFSELKKPMLNFGVQNADPEKMGSGCIGTATWEMPRDLVSQGTLQEILLKLDPGDPESTIKNCGEIRFRIKRGAFKEMGDPPQASRPVHSDPRVGVLYLTLKKLSMKTCDPVSRLSPLLSN